MCRQGDFRVDYKQLNYSNKIASLACLWTWSRHCNWEVKESRDSLEPLTSKDLDGATVTQLPQHSCEASDFRLGCNCCRHHPSGCACLAGAEAKAEGCCLAQPHTTHKGDLIAEAHLHPECFLQEHLENTLLKLSGLCSIRKHNGRRWDKGLGDRPP